MFRVYDTENKKWIKDNIYLNQDGGLFKIKQSVFGMVKVPLALDSEKYVCHLEIGLPDKNGKSIFEGDYIKGVVDEEEGQRIITGLVAYAQHLSSYVVLCFDSDEYFPLGEYVSDRIEIVGNVFDGYEEVKENEEQSKWIGFM